RAARARPRRWPVHRRRPDDTGERHMSPTRKPAGLVAVVGAGPGDPGLLTRRAMDAIGTAEHIFHDRRIPEPLLAEVRTLARPQADLAPVEGGPEEVAKTLVETAGAGGT